MNKNKKIIKLIEKPLPKSNLAVTVYFFDKKLLNSDNLNHLGE